MKLDFALPRDNRRHEYCLACRAEAVRTVMHGSHAMCHCDACGQTLPRSLIIDPAIDWWLGDDKEYWHKTAGIFVRNPQGQFLFFERTKFPFGLTVPAGHVDRGEQPLTAALRELGEEVGISAQRLEPIATDNLAGDSCRRGSDAHVWHSFLLVLDQEIEVEVAEEGERPVWLTLTQEKAVPFTWATQAVIERNTALLLQ